MQINTVNLCSRKRKQSVLLIGNRVNRVSIIPKQSTVALVIIGQSVNDSQAILSLKLGCSSWSLLNKDDAQVWILTKAISSKAGLPRETKKTESNKIVP